MNVGPADLAALPFNTHLAVCLGLELLISAIVIVLSTIPNFVQPFRINTNRHHS
jgi:hypothetical protein